MSGGSYNYGFRMLEEYFDCAVRVPSPRRMAFVKLLMLVRDACHDIEWVDSCDYGAGREDDAIDRVFSFMNTDPDVIAKAAAYDETRARIADLMGLSQEDK